MSSIVDNASTARRPHDAEATRRSLLEAAGEAFDELGYERATTREIGERAGVDPALIARYFDCKEGLFLAAIEEGPWEEEVAYEPAALLGYLIERWDERGHSPISRALASPALTDDVRGRVRTVIRRRIVERLAAVLGERGVGEPVLRAELLVALAVGVAMTRANGTLPKLASAPRERVLAELAPMLETLGGA